MHTNRSILIDLEIEFSYSTYILLKILISEKFFLRYTIGPLPCYPVLPKAVNNINQKLYFDLFEYSWMPYLVNNLFCNFQKILIL